MNVSRIFSQNFSYFLIHIHTFYPSKSDLRDYSDMSEMSDVSNLSELSELTGLECGEAIEESVSGDSDVIESDNDGTHTPRNSPRALSEVSVTQDKFQKCYFFF